MTTGSSPEANADALASDASAVVDTSTPDNATKPESTSPDAKPADSSAADDAGAKKTTSEELLSIVKKAVGDKAPDTDGQSPEPVKKDGPEGQAKVESDAESPEAKAEAEASVPFHNHPRWKKVLTERDSAMSQVVERDQRIQALEPEVASFREITGFMRDKSLSAAEVSDGLVAMGNLKTNPVAALARLGPIVDQLRVIVGESLPADLQEKVDQGFVDEATAKETARLRGEAVYRQSHDTEQAQRTQRAGQETQAREVAAQCSAAVGAWEADVRTKDPDYARKAPMVEKYAKRLIAEQGLPTTQAGATKLVADAYAEVNRDLGIALPKRQARELPPQSSRSSTSARPVPQTLTDVVRQAAAAGVASR